MTDKLKCPDCDGEGYIVNGKQTIVCCNCPNEDGSCCGNGIPGYEPDIEQCVRCECTGFLTK